MTTLALEKSLTSLQRHMSEYLPQLQAAIAAIDQLRENDPDSEEFSQALADLQVAATILEPYSEGIVEAINNFTDDRPEQIAFTVFFYAEAIRYNDINNSNSGATVAYSDFTVRKVKQTFGITTIEGGSFFPEIEPIAPGAMLTEFLKETLPLSCGFRECL